MLYICNIIKHCIMKRVKLILAIVLLIAIGTMSFASQEEKYVVIWKTGVEKVNVRAELVSGETMLILITDEDGETVLKDEISNSPRIVNKTYDFKKSHFGIYKLQVFVNGELVKATVISDNKISQSGEIALAVR